MVYPIPETIENAIESFEASYTLNGPFSGRITFADCNCDLDPQCLPLCQPICAGINVEDISVNCCDDTEIPQSFFDCYEENQQVDWVKGLLSSYGNQVLEGKTTFSVSSFFRNLFSKPINTQQFCGSLLSQVLPLATQIFAGIPANLICINSFEDTKIKGPIEGNDTFAELQLLAQAGCANLFVQVGGCLTIEKWKDNTDPTEIVIPPELVIDANPAEYNTSLTSVIRARGAQVSTLNCGSQTLSQNRLGRGSVKKCAIAGIPTPCLSTTYNNLLGSEEDAENAEVLSNNVNAVGGVQNTGDGTLTQEISNAGGQWFTTNSQCFDSIVVGTTQDTFNEGIVGGFGYGPNFGYGFGGTASVFNTLQNAFARRFPVPYSIFGLGAYGNPFFNNSSTSPNASSQYYADQPSLQQCETVAISNQWLRCGARYEDIQNKYVPTKERLFDLALRRFQEISLAQNTWNVEVPYIPCLRLNQMVEFTVPCTEDCPEQVIKGIIGGINISHSQDGDGECTTMRLAISDVSCLGQTAYTSGNLINIFCGGEDGLENLNPWAVSATGIDSGSAVSGCATLWATVGATAFAGYTHECAEIGCEYQYSFDYETIQGLGFIQFTDPSGIPTSIIGSGRQIGSFVAGIFNPEFLWRINLPFNDIYVKISNIQIIKTVIA